MTKGDRQLVQRWLDWAGESLEAARLLCRHAYWAGAINRAYYACFYAGSAPILTRDLSAAKHAGVRTLLDREFFKTGLIEKRLGDFYNELFGKRIDSDYKCHIPFTPEQVGQYVTLAEEFVGVARGLVQQALRDESR